MLKIILVILDHSISNCVLDWTSHIFFLKKYIWLELIESAINKPWNLNLNKLITLHYHISAQNISYL